VDQSRPAGDSGGKKVNGGVNQPSEQDTSSHISAYIICKHIFQQTRITDVFTTGRSQAKPFPIVGMNTYTY